MSDLLVLGLKVHVVADEDHVRVSQLVDVGELKLKLCRVWPHRIELFNDGLCLEQGHGRAAITLEHNTMLGNDGSQ